MRARSFFLASISVSLVSMIAAGCAGSQSSGFDDGEAGTPTWGRGNGDAGTGARDAAIETTTDAGLDGALDSSAVEISDAGDAATASASDSGPDASDAGSVMVVTTDPFDPSACGGAALTFEQAAAKFAAGGSDVELRGYPMLQRTRTCTSVTGCSPWSAAVQAEAQNPEGNLTGGFSLQGGVVLDVEGAHLGFRWNDDSLCSFCGPSLQYVSNETTGPMTFAPFTYGYTYTVEDELYIPASPQDEHLVGTFTITADQSCVKVLSAEVGPSGPNVIQYGAITTFY